ncbi:UNVERIFIED_CONTAM: hypothetical protein GTU68_066744, partial [Idotea baltica]|nr:hypothetical protein [Idotea baltica]
NGIDPVDLFGEQNKKINVVKLAYPDVQITSRGNSIKLVGQKKLTQAVKEKLETMIRLLKQNKELSMHTVTDLMNGAGHYKFQLENGGNGTIVHSRTGRPIAARTENQKRLVEASNKNDVVFSIGPAGTGKTYTAVALAVAALKNKTVKKIILTRPAVEAGESLGFLPGDLQEKVDPYLRPLYDALDDMI